MYLAKASILSLRLWEQYTLLKEVTGTFVETADTRKGFSTNPMGSKEMDESQVIKTKLPRYRYSPIFQSAHNPESGG